MEAERQRREDSRESQAETINHRGRGRLIFYPLTDTRSVLPSGGDLDGTWIPPGEHVYTPCVPVSQVGHTGAVGRNWWEKVEF